MAPCIDSRLHGACSDEETARGAGKEASTSNASVTRRLKNEMSQYQHQQQLTEQLDELTSQCQYHNDNGSGTLDKTLVRTCFINPLTPTVAMGTAAIKNPVPDRVEPSFVIFDIRAL